MTGGVTRWPAEVDGPPRTGRESEGSWVSPGYRSSHVRGWVLAVILTTIILVDLLAIWLDLRGVVLMGDAEAGTLTEETAVAFDQLHGAVGFLQTGLLVVSAVALLAWLSRVVDNVPPLTGHTPQRGPRAAIGWWFVPVASFVVPFLIVADTARRLRPAGDPMGILLPAWWALWLASSLLGVLLVRLPTGTIDELRTAYLSFAGADLLDAVAALLLVAVVWRFERWSQARAVQAAIPAVDAIAQPPIDPKESEG